MGSKLLIESDKGWAPVKGLGLVACVLFGLGA